MAEQAHLPGCVLGIHFIFFYFKQIFISKKCLTGMLETWIAIQWMIVARNIEVFLKKLELRSSSPEKDSHRHCPSCSLTPELCGIEELPWALGHVVKSSLVKQRVGRCLTAEGWQPRTQGCLLPSVPWFQCSHHKHRHFSWGGPA